MGLLFYHSHHIIIHPPIQYIQCTDKCLNCRGVTINCNCIEISILIKTKNQSISLCTVNSKYRIVWLCIVSFYNGENPYWIDTESLPIPSSTCALDLANLRRKIWVCPYVSIYLPENHCVYWFIPIIFMYHIADDRYTKL